MCLLGVYLSTLVSSVNYFCVDFSVFFASIAARERMNSKSLSKWIKISAVKTATECAIKANTTFTASTEKILAFSPRMNSTNAVRTFHRFIHSFSKKN